MEKQYKISVIIPTYNREKTIQRCIDSIINQSYPAYEIIVSDDGSKDHTLKIIYEEYGDKVRIIEQNHRGAQAARNAGIKAAKGEYIAFLDSDDEWLPDKLKIQVEKLQKNPDAVICGDGYKQFDWNGSIPKVYDLTDKEKRTIKNTSRKQLKLSGKSGVVYPAILKEPFCLFQSLLVSRSSLFQIGLLDEKVPSYQEWDTSIRLAKKYDFIYIDNPLFIYHLHDGDTISKSLKKEIDGLEYICDKFQYEIVGLLGKNILIEKYKNLMEKSIKYKDKRAMKYIMRYFLGRANIFLFK